MFPFTWVFLFQNESYFLDRPLTYISIFCVLLVIRYFNHSQGTKRIIRKFQLCDMYMHDYYLRSTELLIW